MVVVVDGYKENDNVNKSLDEMVDEMIIYMNNEKASLKEASKVIASKYKIKSSDLYNEFVRRN